MNMKTKKKKLTKKLIYWWQNMMISFQFYWESSAHWLAAGIAKAINDNKAT